MKIQIKNYSFSALNKQITFTDYVTIDIDSILYIIHVTDHRSIYNPLNKNLKGSVSGNILTLNYDTSLMSDDDELMIYYDKIPDPATEETQLLVKTAIDGITLDTSLLATEETLQALAGFNIPKNDSIYATYPTTSSEVYTYKLAGATVGVVTVEYTDATKAVLTSVIYT